MTKIALLIGISDYSSGLTPLPSATRDIEAMGKVLQHPDMGAFEQVELLKNPDPQTMREAIESLFADRVKTDLVLFFFSGHGLKDDNGVLYFATPQTRKTEKGTLVRSTAVSAEFVHDVMNAGRSRRQIIMLDCCFSGAFDPALQYKKDDGQVDLQGQLGAEGRVVLASSSATEYSIGQQGAQLSLYTRYLVEGIVTGAGDLNGDGLISTLELHEYASDKVQETAPNITPKIIVLKDMGFEIAIAKARPTDPRLRYRKEAQQYAAKGEISPVGRAILTKLQEDLALSAEEAKAIEQEIIRPYQERLEHLREYSRVLIDTAERQYPLPAKTQTELKTFQTILGLRDQDVAKIQQEIAARFGKQTQPAAANASTVFKSTPQIQVPTEARPSLAPGALAQAPGAIPESSVQSAESVNQPSQAVSPDLSEQPLPNNTASSSIAQHQNPYQPKVSNPILAGITGGVILSAMVVATVFSLNRLNHYGEISPSNLQPHHVDNASFLAAAKPLVGEVVINGSKDTFPIVRAISDSFSSRNPQVSMLMSDVDTTPGFQAFCTGEIDLVNSFAPIDEVSRDICIQNGIEYIELPIAYQALMFSVNADNDWAQCLALDELKQIWQDLPPSPINSWQGVRADFPDVAILPMSLNAEQFQTQVFQSKLMDTEYPLRSDVIQAGDAPALVEQIAAKQGALGYFDLAYYARNQPANIRPIAIRNNAGECVAPQLEHVYSGTYTPLSYPVLVHVNKALYNSNPALAGFVQYLLDEQNQDLIDQTGYIPLSDSILEDVKMRLINETTGSSS